MGVVVGKRKKNEQLLYLTIGPPVSGDVSRGHRNFKRKNLAGESESRLTPHSAHTVLHL